jgi:hypothetical protein
MVHRLRRTSDHLRYGLSLLNGWAIGSAPPWPDMDWTVAGGRTSRRTSNGDTLRDELRYEADAWVDALRRPREVSDVEAGWMGGSVAHLAYHMGAIRQVDRATRGPTAEDEARAQAETGPERSQHR